MALGTALFMRIPLLKPLAKYHRFMDKTTKDPEIVVPSLDFVPGAGDDLESMIWCLKALLMMKHGSVGYNQIIDSRSSPAPGTKSSKGTTTVGSLVALSMCLWYLVRAFRRGILIKSAVPYAILTSEGSQRGLPFGVLPIRNAISARAFSHPPFLFTSGYWSFFAYFHNPGRISNSCCIGNSNSS